MNSLTPTILLGLATILIAGVQGQSNLEIPPLPPGFESRCIFPGLSYLQGCEAELTKTLAFLGLEEVTPVEGDSGELEAQLTGYLQTPEAQPSAKCCKAFCEYSNEICTCEPVAKEYTSSFFGSEESFTQFLSFYTGLCGTVDLFNNCPSDPSAYLLENEPINNCESLGAEDFLEPDMEPAAEGLDDLSE